MDHRYEDGYDPKYGYNRNAFEHKPPQLKVLSAVMKAITAPIALASEAIAHKKQKGSGSGSKSIAEEPNHAIGKEMEEVKDEAAVSNESVSSEQDPDEIDWALDEAVVEISDANNLESEVTNAMAPISLRQPPSYSPIPYPVILPQRRPRTKTRGFVRAYAPSLDGCGIEQGPFLSFLASLHKAAQANPVLQAIQLSANAVTFYPDITVALAAQAVQIATKAAQEMHERWNINKCLDQANQDIFMPRGLYCMVVTYKPGGADDKAAGTVSTKTVDLATSAAAKYAETSADGKVIRRGKFRLASGKTEGEAEMPLQCAQLIYPALDEANAQPAKPTNKNTQNTALSGLKRSNNFVADYYDRRARMVEATRNPDGTLTSLSAKPEFASRMGDPNDGRNKHLLTLLSGGKIQAEPLGARRRWEKAKRKENELLMQGLKTAPGRRFLQEDILYLMIVNMPDEATLARARAELRDN